MASEGEDSIESEKTHMGLIRFFFFFFTLDNILMNRNVLTRKTTLEFMDLVLTEKGVGYR